MTQNEFFNILMDGLKDFPEIKLQDIISYYEHNFTLGLAAGKTEDEIINELGEPNSIVAKCRNEYFNIFSDSKLSTGNADAASSSHTNFNESPNTNVHEDLSDTNNTINDTFNINSNGNDLKNTNELSEVNEENAKLNDNFYELHNSNIASDNKESNSQTNTWKISNENLSTNNLNRNNSNYNSNNSGQNSSTFSNNFTRKNSNNSSSQISVNTILRICIVVLTLIIFFPVITGIIGFFIGLFGVALSIFVASIGVLIGGTFTSVIGLPNVPAFVANFPYPVIVLFSLGSISLSILLILLFYYFCKFFIRVFIKFYNLLKNKGGAF
ncbi:MULTISPECIES: DUF1700 domain-containing protein [unclassified Clostridium]|uniref:DUF1700 domain-containing protein n=1 Tax=unclassified Clostridium TaxID=2614128 RepID=UPI0002972340|nr:MULTISPECIES: DUF1700 domain-containing protein [unclassified Clostridium]EKQ50582.1 MAG: Membrane transport protein [Clostridium sp. Maddingley MBC34-26]